MDREFLSVAEVKRLMGVGGSHKDHDTSDSRIAAAAAFASERTAKKVYAESASTTKKRDRSKAGSKASRGAETEI